mmetsp:Transcript_30402/g.71736  ORF Transcript_30402/g.71736 Transcript_30402/m.71736 type:complete len:205 (-) Transcript_30402:203-817(-)
MITVVGMEKVVILRATVSVGRKRIPLVRRRIFYFLLLLLVLVLLHVHLAIGVATKGTLESSAVLVIALLIRIRQVVFQVCPCVVMMMMIGGRILALWLLLVTTKIFEVTGRINNIRVFCVVRGNVGWKHRGCRNSRDSQTMLFLLLLCLRNTGRPYQASVVVVVVVVVVINAIAVPVIYQPVWFCDPFAVFGIIVSHKICKRRW